jgi:exopolysaccharide/PEP-CTERM locus tyrosine autokinase
MSIVESVLNKAKDSNVAREQRALDRRTTPVVAEPAPRARHAAVSIDLEQVRRVGMLPPTEHANVIAEEFRRIKWPLVAAATGKGGTTRLPRGNLLLVTSAVPGEGKSFISMNLALSVASERDCRVLLIDADTAKARTTRLCGLIDRPGLTDLLSDETRNIDDLILDSGIPGLEVLPAGRADPRSPELFASRRAERLLQDLAERHPDQVIIIDSAPLLATSEAQVLARIAGQVLMVVRADTTARRDVMDAIALLSSGSVVRCVLNQMPSGPFGEQYYYKYEREPR